MGFKTGVQRCGLGGSGRPLSGNSHLNGLSNAHRAHWSQWVRQMASLMKISKSGPRLSLRRTIDGIQCVWSNWCVHDSLWPDEIRLNGPIRASRSARITYEMWLSTAETWHVDHSTNTRAPRPTYKDVVSADLGDRSWPTAVRSTSHVLIWPTDSDGTIDWPAKCSKIGPHGSPVASDGPFAIYKTHHTHETIRTAEKVDAYGLGMMCDAVKMRKSSQGW